MLKKRLKGLLAMLVAGSVAASSLMTSASATISGNIGIVDSIYTVDPNDIIRTDGVYSFEGSSNDAISGYLDSNNLWAIYADKGGTESGYIITTAKGDELAEKLYGLNDSSTEYENVKIKNSHKVLVTTDDPSVTNTNVSGAENVSEFPHEISFSDFGFTPINSPLQEATWTVWYGAEFGNTVDRYSVEKGASYAIPAGSTEIEIPMSTVENIYKPVSGGSTIPFGIGVTIIQLQNNYKTFKIPVFDGLGKPTDDKISVTNDSTGNLIPVGETEALNGEYVLLYNGECFNYNANYIKTKADLWTTIESVASDKHEFDVSKAKLVRYVGYSSNGGDFTSIDLAKGITNDGITYLNGRKNDDYILNIWLPIGTGSEQKVEVVSGGSFDTRMSGLLETENYNCYMSVGISCKDTIYITAVNPASLTPDLSGNRTIYETKYENDSPVSDNYMEFNFDGRYPVNVSDLFSSFNTARIDTPLTNGTLEPGQKFDTTNWEFWPCSIASGISTKTKGTVHDKDKITLKYYQNNGEYTDKEVLVYFPKVDIAPSLTVTAPSIGGEPSITVSSADEIGGYTVKNGSASWSVGGTSLTGGAKFEAGKQYTFSVILQPEADLQFANTTAVKINGNTATATLNNDDGTLRVSYTFGALTAPTTPTNPTYPTYPTYPTHPTTPTTPTTPDKPEEPKEPEDNGNEPDWGDISKEIEKAKDGDKIDIDMGDTSVLPGDILDSIAGKDITIVLDMGDGLTWTINGMDVTNPGDIDMGVSLESEGIPVQVINLVTGELSYVTITLNHSGDFGFTAVLTIDMGKENKGFYANLYYYNEEISDAEFMCAGKINSKGKADLTFTHASEYIIVIDRYSHENKDDIDASEEDTTDSEVDAGTDKPSDDNPSTGVGISCTALLFAGMAVIASAKRRKREE